VKTPHPYSMPTTYCVRSIAYSQIEGRELFDFKSGDYAVVDTSVVMVDAPFLSNKDGGRHTLRSFKPEPWYRPHIVIQAPTVRSPLVDANGIGTEEYLGVQFIDGPKNPKFEKSNRCSIRLVYQPSSTILLSLMGRPLRCVKAVV